MARETWSREQLIAALSLYCQVPFGKMHARNPAIIALATTIGRTPSAVAFKLVNFASLDPELRGRGIGGMGNTSAADREVWAEFYGKWELLAEHSILAEVSQPTDSATVEQLVERAPPEGLTEFTGLATHRRGQSFFRWAVLATYDRRCCITGVACEPLLRASHIVPWSCNPSLRLDPRNGLCLNALHDAAFDRGLITLTDACELRVARRLKDEIPEVIYREMFEIRVGVPIAVPERFKPTPDMLEFHRSHVFQN